MTPTRPIDAAYDLGQTVDIVAADEWAHGRAMDVYRYQCTANQQPIVEAKMRQNQAALTVALIHEYAHALLLQRRRHRIRASEAGSRGRGGRVRDRAVLELDTSGSALHPVAWQDDEMEALQDRLGRISSTAKTIIKAVVG